MLDEVVAFDTIDTSPLASVAAAVEALLFRGGMAAFGPVRYKQLEVASPGDQVPLFSSPCIWLWLGPFSDRNGGARQFLVDSGSLQRLVIFLTRMASVSGGDPARNSGSLCCTVPLRIQATTLAVARPGAERIRETGVLVFGRAEFLLGCGYSAYSSLSQ